MSAHTLNSQFRDEPVVNVQNLKVFRGRYTAVQNVSFQLYPGTSTAIVGPNGSGKSTIVQAMLDIIPRAAGSVEIFGQPLSRLNNLRQQIGYMPQNFIFDRAFPISVWELVGLGWTLPHGSVGAWERGSVGDGKDREAKGQKAYKPLHPKFSSHPNFRFPWQALPEKSEAIAQALRRVKAYHLRQQAIGTLSGGEMKRVLLAYCLVAPRRLLVLDEAFAEVDAQGESEFYDLLRELMLEEGWTLLQVSHDLDMVSNTCDQILCVNRSLICSGRPDHALSPENLLATYGPTFARYYHKH
jgi:zinc transport system ATP-binding protein